MHCPTCTDNAQSRKERKKAKVIKTQTDSAQTHRIYRCTYFGCGDTFHTIEIPRDRYRELESIEREARNFADRFHR